MSPNAEDRLALLEARIAKIEGQLGIPSPSPEAPKPIQGAPTLGAPLSPSTAASLPQNRSSSGQALGTVATLCFVLAGTYIVKLAIDAGWLTPLRQVLMAGTFGALLIFAGFYLRKKDAEYAGFLPAAGVLVLDATILGASAYYGILTGIEALALLLLNACICVGLYRSFNKGLYLVIASVGSYLLPLTLGLQRDNLELLHGYFLVSSATFCLLSVWADARALTLTSAYLALAVVSGLGSRFGDPGSVAALVAVHFAIYVTGVTGHSLYRKKPMTVTEAGAYFPLVLFFYAIEYAQLNKIIHEAVNWVALAFVACLNGVYFFARKRLPQDQALASGDTVFATTIIVLFHSLYFGILLEEFRPAVLVAALLGLAFAGPKMPEIKHKITRIAGMVALAYVAILNYLEILLRMTFKSDPFWLTYGFLITLSLLILYSQSRRERTMLNLQSAEGLLLTLAHIQAVASLYQLTKDVGSLAVSSSWACYAAAILGIGIARRDKTYTHSSLIILIAATGKALLYDVRSAAPGVRILCLLLTGALLYGAGFLFRKTEFWSEERNAGPIRR